MYKDAFSDIMPILLKELGKNFRLKTNEATCFRLTTTVSCYTSTISLETVREANEMLNPLFSIELIDPSHFKLTILLPKKSFKGIEKDQLPEAIFIKATKHINMMCVGLSIATLGRFWWHGFNWRDRFIEKFDNESNSQIDVELKHMSHPVSFYTDGKLQYALDTKLFDISSFLIGLLFISKSQLETTWRLVSLNYIKGLHLFATPVADINFYDEIFMCYYRCLENLCTVSILKKKSLKNEHKDITRALEICKVPKQALVEFNNVYKIRSSIVAHCQNPNSTLATFEHAHDVKILVDLVLQNIILSEFVKTPVPQFN